MHELNRSEYSKVLEILNNKQHSIFPATVCEGNNPGWIFVDNVTNPTSALVYTNYLGGTLVGKHDNIDFNTKLKEALDNIIIPKVQKDNNEEFDLSGDSDNWDEVIKHIFHGKDIDTERIKRFEYKNPATPNFPINPDYKFQRITSDILKNTTLTNIDKLLEEIDVWFNNIDDFLENSFGFVALKDNELCGWSIGVCRFQNKIEIAIETIEAFRKKGVATTLSSLFINYCNTNGYTPEWECMHWNAASETIALKLGFNFSYNYNVYSISLK